MQCILAIRETYKAEQVKYRGTRPLQFPPPFPPFSPYTHLSQKKRGRAVSTLTTHVQASLMVVEFYLYPTVGTVLIHSIKPELTE